MTESDELAASIARRKWYEMELEQLKLAEQSGELVPVSDVRREFRRVLGRLGLKGGTV